MLTTFVLFLIQFIVLIVIIALLVFVHELGHFLAAKLGDVKVTEFALGFGKPVWKRQRGETLYRINSVPLGGYVTMEGEDGTVNDSPRNYRNKPWAVKALILVAGVGMNTILAFVLFALFLALSNYNVRLLAITDFQFNGTETVSFHYLVQDVIEGSVAQGHFEEGKEAIIAGNGSSFFARDALNKFLDANKGKQVDLTVVSWENTSNQRTVTVTLPSEPKNNALLGVQFVPIYDVNYPRSLTAAVSHSGNILGYQFRVLGETFQKSLETRDPSLVTDQVGSIVAVGVFVGDILASGEMLQLINLTALVSLSLALFNILPLPALDGGHLLIVTIESITRRKVPPHIVNAISQVGFVVLMVFGVLIMFKDVIQFEIFTNIFNTIRSGLGR